MAVISVSSYIDTLPPPPGLQDNAPYRKEFLIGCARGMLECCLANFGAEIDTPSPAPQIESPRTHTESRQALLDPRWRKGVLQELIEAKFSMPTPRRISMCVHQSCSSRWFN